MLAGKVEFSMLLEALIKTTIDFAMLFACGVGIYAMIEFFIYVGEIVMAVIGLPLVALILFLGNYKRSKSCQAQQVQNTE